MEPNDIELKSINKLFEYEKVAREIDSLSPDDSKKYAKLFCRLYLAQQETLAAIHVNS